MRAMMRGLLLLPLLFSTAPARVMDSENCLGCHALRGLATQDSTGVLRDFHVVPESWGESVHGGLACRQCHTAIESVPHGAAERVDCTIRCHMIDPRTGVDFSHRAAGVELARSVHGSDSAVDGRPRPACKDCHLDSFYWQTTPPSLVEAERKCRSCHQDYVPIDQDLRHLTLHLSENQYWRHKLNYEVCVRCHSERELVTDSLALGPQADIVGGFLRSFHGTGFRLGDRRSPVCADCHGYHLVRSHRDSLSTIHPANLERTCSTAGCHDGSQAQATTSGSMHRLYQGWRLGLLAWVTRLYAALLLGLALAMILHNLLESRAIARWRGRVAQSGAQPLYRRSRPAERVAHLLQMGAFSLLALTGAALWLPEGSFSALGEPTLFLEGRAWAHRCAALLMIALTLWRVLVVLLSARGRDLLAQRLPRRGDAGLLRRHLAWLTGRASSPAPFGLYRLHEKWMFWGFVWSSAMLALTGALLWLHGEGRLFLVDLARAVHSLEALLAVTVVTLWHLWEHLAKPGRWLWSDGWLTGRMERGRMELEHAGLLAELDAGRAPAGFTLDDFRGGDELYRPLRERLARSVAARAAGALCLVLALGTCSLMAWGLARSLRAAQSPADPLQEERAAALAGLASDDPWRILAAAPADAAWLHARFHDAAPAPVPAAGTRRSECLLCHPPLPHVSSRAERAFLNLHGRFMTCEGCHGIEAQRPGAAYAWVDLGGPAARPAPSELPGALISVTGPQGPVFQDLASPRAARAAAAGPLDDEARRRLQKDYHDRVAPLAALRLACGDCHEQAGRVDFAGLGFDPARVVRLRSATKAASVANYQSFHLPPQE